MKDSPLLLKTDLVRATLEGRKTQTRRPVKDLKVRLRRDVRSDLSSFIQPLVLKKGVYKAVIGDAGAVCAIDRRGKWLGLKPGEFDFVCPYSDGPTYLADYGDRKGWRVKANASTVWVRETWAAYTTPSHEYGDCDEVEGAPRDMRGELMHVNEADIVYAADKKNFPDKWRPSIHMPRWAARLTMPLTSIRLERVNAITEDAARAEGVAPAWLDENGKDVNAHSPPTFRQGFARTWVAIYGDESWKTGWCWALEWAPLKGAKNGKA